jgi:16S rRNA (guanine1516-N2)-methyltransferase
MMNERLRLRGFSLERIVDDGKRGDGASGESKLALKDLEDESMSPLTVDFTSPALLHRLKQGVSRHQPLGKALGLKSINPDQAPFVFDATAGLGTDALVIAALGCRVRSLERSDVIYALLQDGKARLENKARGDEGLEAISARMSFENADAQTVLNEMARGSVHESGQKPDVIYLDPMYPEEGRSKSALPKKTMQMFRRLLDGDDDANELWEIAMKVALNRVVVKRPMKAPSLGAVKPSHSYEGKTARFDLYLAR